MTLRVSITSLEGKGTLRRLTQPEIQRFYPSAPNRQYMGFFPPRAKTPKLTFRLDDCFDENGNYFQEAVE